MKQYLRHMNIRKLVDNIPNETCLYTEDEAREYLLILNRTWWDNGSSIDVTDYEKLIYIKVTYKDNPDIQNLVSIIEEKVCDNYIFKQKYIKRITDNIIDPTLDPNEIKGYFTDGLMNVL